MSTTVLGVRSLLAVVAAVFAVYWTLYSVMSPEDSLPWSLRISISCISSFMAVGLYPKERSGWSLRLVGWIFVCLLLIALAAKITRFPVYV